MAKRKPAEQKVEEKPVDGINLDQFAQYIADEYRKRKSRRSNREKHWAEVDRQIAMDNITRTDSEGRTVDGDGSEWMPEIELPLQAEALEVLCTDARRLMFSDDEAWFDAHAALTDDFIKRWEGTPLIGGDEFQIPTKITQDAADKVVEGALNFFHRRYDFKQRVDLFNSESFKYGTAAFRGMMVREDKFTQDATGLKAIRGLVPQFVVVSIKNLYLDDAPMFAMHEGVMIAPSYIREYWQNVHDVRLAATLGQADKSPFTGGWIPSQVVDLVGIQSPDGHKDHAQLLEFEGDFVSGQGSSTVFVPNIIATIVLQAGGPRIVRIRERELPFRSYGIGFYHRDDVDSPYGIGPLVKGVPIQKCASEAANRLIQAAALNTEPPIAYDPNDWHLQNAGGPRIAPGAQWPAMSNVVPQNIGNPAAMMQVYQGLVKQYQDLSGVNDARMGASTQTHKTAFAVDAEQTRGVIRTVDYVKAMMAGPLASWLYMHFHMAKLSLKKQKQMVFLDDYKGFVEVDDNHFPDDVVFDVFGAAGTMERQQQNQFFLQILPGLAQIEPLAIKLGAKPMDWDKLRSEALRRGGLTDTETYFKAPISIGAPNGAPAVPLAGVPGAAQGQPPVPGTPQPSPQDTLTALAAQLPAGRG